MLRFERPPKNSGFDDAVETSKENVENAIDQGNKPSFPEKWKDFKDDFSAAQDGRCGYCEMPVIGGQFGDVEHYAPKSVVNEIKTAGQEKPNLSNVAGRTFKELSARGYWWLAYDWDNYLLSCAICNRTWKEAVFPVEEGANRRLPPTETVQETPLLLNPFGRKNPAKHLLFGTLGEVTPRNSSKFGRATIDVCGLDRPSLRLQRLATIEDTHALLRDLADATTTADEDRALKSLHGMGRSRPGARFPGVVRSIFENETGMSWNDLEDAVA